MQLLIIIGFIVLSGLAIFLYQRLPNKISENQVLIFESQLHTEFVLAQSVLDHHEIPFSIKVTKDEMLPIGSYQIWVTNENTSSAREALSV